MAATWVSKMGVGMASRLLKISTSWRQAWNTLTIAGSRISARKGSRSISSARGSITAAPSMEAAWIRHSLGQ